MLNRPNSLMSEQGPGGTSVSGGDRHTQIRFVLLWFMMVTPVLIIWARVAHLQLALQNDYVVGFSVTTEVFEEIPAQDGRIFAADQTLLAGDVRRICGRRCSTLQFKRFPKMVGSGKARLRLSKSDQKSQVKRLRPQEKAECDC